MTAPNSRPNPAIEAAAAWPEREARPAITDWAASQATEPRPAIMTSSTRSRWRSITAPKGSATPLAVAVEAAIALNGPADRTRPTSSGAATARPAASRRNRAGERPSVSSGSTKATTIVIAAIIMSAAITPGLRPVAGPWSMAAEAAITAKPITEWDRRSTVVDIERSRWVIRSTHSSIRSGGVDPTDRS